MVYENGYFTIVVQLFTDSDQYVQKNDVRYHQEQIKGMASGSRNESRKNRIQISHLFFNTISPCCGLCTIHFPLVRNSFFPLCRQNVPRARYSFRNLIDAKYTSNVNQRRSVLVLLLFATNSRLGCDFSIRKALKFQMWNQLVSQKISITKT